MSFNNQSTWKNLANNINDNSKKEKIDEEGKTMIIAKKKTPNRKSIKKSDFSGNKQRYS